MDKGMTGSDRIEEQIGRVRLRVYLISSAFATFVFLLFAYVMAMVPRAPTDQNLWMLSIAGTLLVVSLGMGIWKFRTSEAPFMAGPLGSIVGGILILELVGCLFSVFQVSSKVRR